MALPGRPAAGDADGLDRFFPAIEPTGRRASRWRSSHNNPGEGHLPIRTAFRDAVDGAQRRLYVISPYLADHAILRGHRSTRPGAASTSGSSSRPNPTRCPRAASVRHWFQALQRRRRRRPRAPRDGPREGRPGRRHRPRRDGQPRRAQPPPELGAAAPDRGPGGRRPVRPRAVRSRRRDRDAGARCRAAGRSARSTR